MALFAAARTALTNFQQTQDPAHAWCLIDDEASQQRYVYAGGPLFLARDEITIQDTSMTVADLCIMVATQQQLILANGEPAISENLFIRRIRPKYTTLTSEAHMTVYDRKILLGFYTAIYSDSPDIMNCLNVEPVTGVDVDEVPNLLKAKGIPLIIKLTQDSKKDISFDFNTYNKRRDVSSYYSALHKFLASRDVEDKKANQEYMSHYSHGADFLAAIDSAITQTSKHLDFLAPFLTKKVPVSTLVPKEHTSISSVLSLDQAISSLNEYSEITQRAANNPRLTIETDSADDQQMYSGRLSVLSSRVVSHAEILPKTLEIEKAYITSFMHRSTFVITKDFFAARGSRILNTIRDIAQSIDTYKSSLFYSTIYLSSLYATVVPTSYLSKTLRAFTRYCTATVRKDPTDSIRTAAPKIQRPMTFISSNSLHYIMFIAPFIKNNIPIVTDNTLRQILLPLYHKSSDTHQQATERKVEASQGAPYGMSKTNKRYILIPSAYSTSAINERNIIYLIVGGEFIPLNRLEKTKDYRRPQYNYVHQKLKNKDLEAVGFSINNEKLATAADDIILMYKGRTLVFTSDAGKITEQEWESGAVLCVVLEKQASQFNRIRVNKPNEDKLVYVLSKSLGVYFYMKGEESSPPHYKGDNFLSIQLSSLDSNAVRVQIKTLWALIENRLG